MLVLARREREKLVFDIPPSDKSQRIEIVVLHVAGGQVKLGTDALPSVIITRGELLGTKVE